jgi:hypothetical protein
MFFIKHVGLLLSNLKNKVTFFMFDVPYYSFRFDSNLLTIVSLPNSSSKMSLLSPTLCLSIPFFIEFRKTNLISSVFC